jgi:hypothetical protein
MPDDKKRKAESPFKQLHDHMAATIRRQKPSLLHRKDDRRVGSLLR